MHHDRVAAHRDADAVLVNTRDDERARGGVGRDPQLEIEPPLLEGGHRGVMERCGAVHAGAPGGRRSVDPDQELPEGGPRAFRRDGANRL